MCSSCVASDTYIQYIIRTFPSHTCRHYTIQQGITTTRCPHSRESKPSQSQRIRNWQQGPTGRVTDLSEPASSMRLCLIPVAMVHMQTGHVTQATAIQPTLHRTLPMTARQTAVPVPTLASA
jgi:hypothetical protein